MCEFKSMIHCLGKVILFGSRFFVSDLEEATLGLGFWGKVDEFGNSILETWDLLSFIKNPAYLRLL